MHQGYPAIIVRLPQTICPLIGPDYTGSITLHHDIGYSEIKLRELAKQSLQQQECSAFSLGPACARKIEAYVIRYCKFQFIKISGIHRPENGFGQFPVGFGLIHNLRLLQVCNLGIWFGTYSLGLLVPNFLNIFHIFAHLFKSVYTHVPSSHSRNHAQVAELVDALG
jgi:hypothetical protein